MPELMDELSIARSSGTLKKVLESYKKKDLLILDEWLIRPLSPQESYDMLEIVEARCHKPTIFCTQYESEGWYTRIDCYDKMERESMAYFYESQHVIQRLNKRIRQLESFLTANGISIPEED